MKITFTKMQGLGNDFIVIDALKKRFDSSAQTVRRLCDRHFGVGADQLLVIEPSKKADFRMRVFNADGDEVEMCGNGIRCVADYLVRGKKASSDEMAIETLGGILKPKVLKSGVRVDMGEPVLEASLIPTTRTGQIVNEPIPIDGKTLEVTCVSMGNPHCVIFEEKKGEWDLQHWGPRLERHPLFPKKTNVEFAWVRSRKELEVRVWERGAGITLACGTGACATAVAGVLNHLTDRRVKVHLLGGALEIEWDSKSNHVFMTGPSDEVFQGEIELKE